MTSISRRLDKIARQLHQQQDPVYTVMLKDGSKVTCTFEQAWDYFKSGQGHMVGAVAVDRDGYAENAALLEVLCRS